MPVTRVRRCTWFNKREAFTCGGWSCERGECSNRRGRWLRWEGAGPATRCNLSFHEGKSDGWANLSEGVKSVQKRSLAYNQRQGKQKEEGSLVIQPKRSLLSSPSCCCCWCLLLPPSSSSSSSSTSPDRAPPGCRCQCALQRKNLKRKRTARGLRAPPAGPNKTSHTSFLKLLFHCNRRPARQPPSHPAMAEWLLPGLPWPLFFWRHLDTGISFKALELL